MSNEIRDGFWAVVGAIIHLKLRDPVDLDSIFLDAGCCIVLRLLLRAAPILERPGYVQRF